MCYLVACDFVVVDVWITTYVFVYPCVDAIVVVLFYEIVVDEWFSTDDFYSMVVESDFIIDNMSLIGNAHFDSTASVTLNSVILHHHLSPFPHQVDTCLPIE